MNTNELLLTDLLDCGYADLSMLDDLYETIGDEIYSSDERAELIKYSINNGGLNTILAEFYSRVTEEVQNTIYTLLEEQKEIDKNNKNATTLANELNDDTETGEDNLFFLLNKEEEFITYIKDKANKLTDNYPYTNYLDSSFQNELDQTFDSSNNILDNAIDLIKYWLENKEDEENEEE